jgi:hypothetical protein
MWVVLNQQEIALLDKQDPASAGGGGFQSMLVGFQRSLRRGTSELKLSEEDIERIAHYAFDLGNGGWQTRLLGIFGRVLGPSLGRDRANTP